MRNGDIVTCWHMIGDIWKVMKKYLEVPEDKRDDAYWHNLIYVDIENTANHYDKSWCKNLCLECLVAFAKELNRLDKENRHAES